MRTQERDRQISREDDGDLVPSLDPKEAVESVSRAVREHPYAALATAAGIGFLLGGGFGGRIFGAALALGGRLAADALLARALERNAPPDGAVGDEEEEEEEREPWQS